MKETELAEAVVAWLEMEHWDVYQEVQMYAYSGICDIVATKGFLVWTIECKTSLTWGLIEQAWLWRAHFRSIAIPRAKARTRGRRVAYLTCKNFFNLGIIEVHQIKTFDESIMFEVAEQTPAPLMREYHEAAKRIKSRLVPEHKTYAKAGSVRGGYYTPYKYTMSRVKKFITKNPGCTLKEIMDDIGEGHYASMKSARASIRVALDSHERDWCRVDMENKPYKYYLREIEN